MDCPQIGPKTAITGEKTPKGQMVPISRAHGVGVSVRTPSTQNFTLGWSPMSGRRKCGTSWPTLGCQGFALFSFIFLAKWHFKKVWEYTWKSQTFTRRRRPTCICPFLHPHPQKGLLYRSSKWHYRQRKIIFELILHFIADTDTDEYYSGINFS